MHQISSGSLFSMYYRFDVFRWMRQQLPYLLRNSMILAFISVIAQSFKHIQNALLDYCTGVERRLNHNSSTLLLQKWLNDLFGLANGTIYITNYLIEQTYLHYEGETVSPVYLGFQGEDAELYLDSILYSEYGGFIIRVPEPLASDENLSLIRKWVEYYRTAGTVYKIESYE